MHKFKIQAQTQGFLHFNLSSTEKSSSYLSKSRMSQSLFFQAVKFSDPKRKELFGDDQIQSEMDLLRELMLSRRNQSYKLNWNNSMTRFKRYEQLKKENKEVFKRKAAIHLRKDLSLPRIKKYLLNVKKIITPGKKVRNYSYDYSKHNNNAALKRTPIMSQLVNSNQLIVRGMRISLKKSSNIDLFLETKSTLHPSSMKNIKIHFNETLKKY